VPAPLAASLPYVTASALVHVVYFLLVGRLYRNADLSVAYPLMRGLAPLVAMAIAAVTLREVPDAAALIGVLALVVGVVSMGFSGLAHRRIDRMTLIVALFNSVIIATYSVIDGAGARLAGPDAAHALAYNAWSDGLTAVFYLPVVLALRGRAAGPEFVRDPMRSAFAGLAAFGGYAIVVWAMTQASIGAVAALRECSVAFAAIIGVAVLGEPFRSARAAAALLIVGGVIALRLA
jgi:drug/metabolite transporter (DMT)-like permease